MKCFGSSVLVMAALQLGACQWLSGLHEYSEKTDALQVAGAGGSAVEIVPMPMLTAGQPAAGSGGAPVPPPPPPVPPPLPVCNAPAGSECDWLSGCGCNKDQHCQVRGADNKGTCVPIGIVPLGGVCKGADDCASGTCDHHTCRSYCDHNCDAGKCTPSTGADDKVIPGVNVCWISCQIEGKDTCPMGTTCQLQAAGGAKQAFCVAPADPCPTVWDGVCDEPTVCAPGTDTKDCSCKRSLPGSACDLVEQCGCVDGFSCKASGADRATPMCVKSGLLELGASCMQDGECGPALQCIGHACREYCAKATDCSGQGDLCSAIVVTEAGVKRELPGVSACVQACDYNTGAPCKAGSSCQRWPTGKAYCDECRPEISGGECNLAQDCGCELKKGTACTLIADADGKADTQCLPRAGAGTESTACEFTSDCQAGLGCIGFVCRRYCSGANDCNGSCLEVSFGAESIGVRACFRHCGSTGDVPCGSGVACKSVKLEDSTSTTLCDFIPLTTTCPTTNKRCDEPKGSGLCSEGFDTAECK